MGKTIIPSINMTGLPSEPTWYLVITKYNHEDAFAKDLLKGLKDYRMEDKIIDCCTFLEEIQEEKVNKKGELKVKVKVNKPFMNYVAVKAIMNNDVWNYIRMRKGVAAIYAPDGTPATLTDSEIDNMKLTCGLI
jgi:transcription antitermination factor NusG